MKRPSSRCWIIIPLLWCLRYLYRPLDGAAELPSPITHQRERGPGRASHFRLSVRRLRRPTDAVSGKSGKQGCLAVKRGRYWLRLKTQVGRLANAICSPYKMVPSMRRDRRLFVGLNSIKWATHVGGESPAPNRITEHFMARLPSHFMANRVGQRLLGATRFPLTLLATGQTQFAHNPTPR